MSLQTDWLANPDATRILLAEVRSYDTTENVHYLSSGEYQTEVGDTPASTYFTPSIVGNPVFNRQLRSIFDSKSVLNWGGLDIKNHDGGFDLWLGYAWDGRQIILKIGDPAWDYDQFIIVLTGVIHGLEVINDTTLRLVFRDRMAELDIPTQPNDFSSGFAENEPIPMAYGELKNITPVLIDDVLKKFKIHDGQIDGISTVYENGSSVGFAPDLPNGEFTLDADPAGKITCDCTGAKPGGTYYTKAGDIIKDLVTRVGPWIDPDDLETASFTALNTDAPQPLGVYVSKRRNLLDVIEEIMESVGGFYGLTPSGKLDLQRWKVPGVPVLTVDRSDTLGKLRVELLNLPRWKTQLGYEKNWSIQVDGIAGIVTPARQAWLGKEYRVVTSKDATIKTRHLGATAPDVRGTFINNVADAQAEADRLQALFGVQRIRYRVTAFSGPFQVKIGDTVTLIDDFYGLSAGKDCVVIGKREFLLDNKIELTLFA